LAALISNAPVRIESVRQYWLFLLLLAAIHQPAVACSAQKPWIWLMPSLPETAAMLAVTGCYSPFFCKFACLAGRSD
jgi:hypothetical protein